MCISSSIYFHAGARPYAFIEGSIPTDCILQLLHFIAFLVVDFLSYSLALKFVPHHSYFTCCHLLLSSLLSILFVIHYLSVVCTLIAVFVWNANFSHPCYTYVPALSILADDKGRYFERGISGKTTIQYGKLSRLLTY